MEDELRIKCGNKWAILAICCIAIAVFMAVNEKNLPMDRDIVALISGILMGIGWFVLLLFPGRVYKVDRKGITVYVRNAGIFTPWSDCVFMGVDREIILFIVCIRRQGDCALKIPYNQQIFEKMGQYAPENIVDRTWPDRQKRVYVAPASIVLRDIEEEWFIDNSKKYDEAVKSLIPAMGFLIFLFFVLGAITVCVSGSIKDLFVIVVIPPVVLLGLQWMIFEIDGKKIIVSREGIRKEYCLTHKIRFFSWQSFERIGVKYEQSRRGYLFMVWPKGRNKDTLYTTELRTAFAICAGRSGHRPSDT